MTCAVSASLDPLSRSSFPSCPFVADAVSPRAGYFYSANFPDWSRIGRIKAPGSVGIQAVFSCSFLALLPMLVGLGPLKKLVQEEEEEEKVGFPEGVVGFPFAGVGSPKQQQLQEEEEEEVVVVVVGFPKKMT